MKDYGVSKEFKRVTSPEVKPKGFKEFIKKVGKKVGVEKGLKSNKKFKSKKLLRSQRAVVEIKENKPEPYSSIYFKEQYLKEKKNLFLR